MSIYIYDTRKFYGCRVAVKVGKERKVRYLSFVHKRKKGQKAGTPFTSKEIKTTLKFAKEIELRWLEEQKIQTTKRIAEAIPTVRNPNTGVKGIIFESNVSSTGKVLGRFKVQISGASTSFSVAKYGYEEAWRKAVKKLAEEKGIKTYAHLLSRKPNFDKVPYLANARSLEH